MPLMFGKCGGYLDRDYEDRQRDEKSNRQHFFQTKTSVALVSFCIRIYDFSRNQLRRQPWIERDVHRNLGISRSPFSRWTCLTQAGPGEAVPFWIFTVTETARSSAF